jgi:hypothetical protein
MDCGSARRIIHVLFFILTLSVALPVGCMLYIEFVPAYSSSSIIPETDTAVSVKFYWVEDEMKDNGRRVTIRSPEGTITRKMCGYDWAHWARTGVYRTERGIAVLGPRGCDYLFSLHPLAETASAGNSSDQWIYLGAFDFVGYPRGTADPRRLRFISASEQAECIEMATEQFKASEPTARNHVRRMRCPLPEPRLSKPEN